MPDADYELDEQDQSEAFDEDNTNGTDRPPGEEAEQLEDLDEVYDATSAVGDDDEDEELIGEDMDDDDIVASARDDDDDDLEDDDLRRRDAQAFHEEETLSDETDGEDVDDRDHVGDQAEEEAELEYAADASDRVGARSAAQRFESRRLSDADLHDLDYDRDVSGEPPRETRS